METLPPSTWVVSPQHPIERKPGHLSVLDVIDRVLDKGIVIDAWIRVSLVGIDLLSVEVRVVVASIDTYVKHADVLSFVKPAPAPLPSPPAGRPRAAALRAA